MWCSLENIWGRGGDVVDNPLNPTRVIIDSPQTVAGLALEQSMITDSVSPQDVVELDDFGSLPLFYDGEAVVCRHWPWVDPLIDAPSSRLSRQQVQATPIPAGTACLGGRNLCINNASDAASQEAAWEFIQYLASDNIQQERAVNEAWLPTREAVYQRPEVQQVPII